MDSFGWVVDLSTIVLALANIILIFIIYSQFRDQRKPIITNKILGETVKNGTESKQPTLMMGPEHTLIISNISNKVASKLKIYYEFFSDSKKLAQVSEELDYLNPNELTRMFLKTEEIITNHPDLFEEKTEGQNTKKIPKKAMNLLLDIHISYNPIFGKFSPYKIKDSYELRWDSLENYPTFKDHPRISCWNKRNNLQIEKMTFKQKKHNE